MIKRRILRSAYAKLILRYPWHHYVTLTSVVPASAEGWEHMFGKYVRRLERRGSAIWWCYALEEGPAGGRIHLHALLGGTDRSAVGKITDAWRSGWAHVSVYDPAQAGAFYITKDIEEGTGEVVFSPNLESHVARWKKVASGSSRTDL
jgi:hypothetical protein